MSQLTKNISYIAESHTKLNTFVDNHYAVRLASHAL